MPVPPGHIVAQLADMHAPACTSTRQGQRVNLFARRQETCLQQHVSAHTYTPPDVSHTWACCPSLPLARLLPRFPCHHRQACSLLTNATVPVLDYNGRITTVPNPFVTYVSGLTAVQHPVGCVGGHGSATLAVCVCSLCGQAGGGGGAWTARQGAGLHGHRRPVSQRWHCIRCIPPGFGVDIVSVEQKRRHMSAIACTPDPVRTMPCVFVAVHPQLASTAPSAPCSAHGYLTPHWLSVGCCRMGAHGTGVGCGPSSPHWATKWPSSSRPRGNDASTLAAASPREYTANSSMCSPMPLAPQDMPSLLSTWRRLLLLGGNGAWVKCPCCCVVA